MISFTKIKLPNGWLGNMASFPIIWNDKVWRSTEHLFQALRFLNNNEIMEEIRNTASPLMAKGIAKKYLNEMVVQPKSEKDLSNMEFVLRLKIEQHPELKKLLIETGNEIIVEDVSNRPGVLKEDVGQRHTFWGMAKRENGEWFGENILGKMWMRLREEISKKEIENEN